MQNNNDQQEENQGRTLPIRRNRTVSMCKRLKRGFYSLTNTHSNYIHFLTYLLQNLQKNAAT